MTFHIRPVADLIARVRAHRTRTIPILVGGYPFNVSAGLWKSVGADGSARDAGIALDEARRLLGA